MIHIEPLSTDRFDEFFRLICALAEYEQLDPPDDQARQRLYDDALERQPPRYRALLALDGHVVCGYCIYLETYSSFLARPTLYVEDIFILPAWRGKGIGRMLMRTLAQIAMQQGCGRMEWIVLDWNEPAHRFYQAIGARQLDQWKLYRLEGKTLARLANAGE
ncbi:MAG: GNAT family N-acetyltransferase [Bacteroidota bacterium]|nr:GNAT family N-acetyltransferase [Candidatus Kapabacteria bacterium]MCS7302560.1 GNAT family N-acetyltransferase [Candidatus Kapabacteria bacterium]MCX7936754.1 GNAT family N-acetyltransferase [Chlorobiota bacterium]MDW8074202.1 GNAT family N-acetyltransferase [Bacteroidota bacterium]MDW8271322.1 GNAT family N-acetyltransferase [Bacteroidota bacterium]